MRWSAGSFSPEGGAAEWIRHQRSYGTGGGWYNVDFVVRQQDRSRWLGPHNIAPLPDGVDYMLARFFQLTPSLTCALVGFVFKNGTALRYENELNKDRKSTRRRSRDWYVSALEPGHLKSQALERVRSEMQTMVCLWFKTNLPGYFCGRPTCRLPTAELLTTETDLLLTSETSKRTGSRSDWRHLVSNASLFDIWTLESCSGFQLSTSQSHRGDDQGLHMVAALRTVDVPEESIKHYGERNQAAYVRYCHEHLDGILSNCAALAFLKEASKKIRSSRAGLKIGKVKGKKSLRALDAIQAFFDRSLGAPAVAAELRARSEHLSEYRHECANFLSRAWGPGDAQREIAKTLQESTSWLSNLVVVEEHSAREHFEQLASILSVRESIRAQRRMEWLTIAALLVATGSLVIALPALKDWLIGHAEHLWSLLTAG